MDDRVTRIGVIVLVALGLGSCQTSRTRSALGKGERLLESDRSAEAVEHFDRAQAHARDPVQRARAFLGMGKAQVNTGQYRLAKTSLYSARDLLENAEKAKTRETASRRRERESLQREVDRWIGEVYLAGGQFELARRYLLRALPGLQGADREVALAEAYFLSRELGDGDTAARYLQQLTRPYSDDVEGIVSERSPRVVEARRRRLARQSESSPPARQAATGEKAETTTRATRPRTVRPKAPVDLRVFDRDDWNARAPRRSRLKPMGSISRITVHHSAGKPFWSHSHADTAAHIRSIQRYHQEEKSWADIGYHYVVDLSGNIWQGRSRTYQGAHAGGTANRGNIGIVVLGNYTRQGLNREQVRSLANLVGQLSDRYGVPHYRIYTHKELQPGHTACPGPALTRVVGQIRGKLRERHLAMGK